MADWLALHDLTPELCKRILESGPIYSPPNRRGAVQRANRSPDEVWHSCGQAVLLRMPQSSAAVDLLLHGGVVNFAPDRVRYPRAFTLHDDGRGRPYVSVPWQDRLSDELVVAHEFGHALQVVASGKRHMPPALRETCAGLLELWELEQVRETQEWSGLQAAYQLRAAKSVNVQGHMLRDALGTPAAEYQYGWNYPVAVRLSERIARGAVIDILWSLFEGRATMPELVRSLRF